MSITFPYLKKQNRKNNLEKQIEPGPISGESGNLTFWTAAVAAFFPIILKIRSQNSHYTY